MKTAIFEEMIELANFVLQIMISYEVEVQNLGTLSLELLLTSAIFSGLEFVYGIGEIK